MATGENMATTCCSPHEAFKSCRDVEMICITLWDQTPLRRAVQEQRGAAAGLSLSALHVCLSISEQGMELACIGRIWDGMPALITAH